MHSSIMLMMKTSDAVITVTLLAMLKIARVKYRSNVLAKYRSNTTSVSIIRAVSVFGITN